MSALGDHCHWCQRTAEDVGHALQRCSGCKILHYCEKTCQTSDWKHHKEECQTIKAGGPMPRFRRVSTRINGVTMLRPGDPSAFTPDPDTVYYTKISMPHVHDVSVAGPFCPMDSIVQHIEQRCIRENSLPALPVLRETIEGAGIVSLGHIVAPLPGGQHMTIEIVREKNAQVATFLNDCPPRSPRPVYTILEQTCHPDHEQILAVLWPHEHIPTLDWKVIKTFL